MFQMDDLMMGGITITACRVGGTYYTHICPSSSTTLV